MGADRPAALTTRAWLRKQQQMCYCHAHCVQTHSQACLHKCKPGRKAFQPLRLLLTPATDAVHIGEYIH